MGPGAGGWAWAKMKVAFPPVEVAATPGVRPLHHPLDHLHGWGVPGVERRVLLVEHEPAQRPVEHPVLEPAAGLHPPPVTLVSAKSHLSLPTQSRQSDPRLDRALYRPHRSSAPRCCEACTVAAGLTPNGRLQYPRQSDYY